MDNAQKWKLNKREITIIAVLTVFMRGFGAGGSAFSAIFMANSAAIIGVAFFISGKSGQNKSEAYLKISFAGMAALSAALVGVSLFAKNPWAAAEIPFCEVRAGRSISDYDKPRP